MLDLSLKLSQFAGNVAPARLALGRLERHEVVVFDEDRRLRWRLLDFGLVVLDLVLKSRMVDHLLLSFDVVFELGDDSGWNFDGLSGLSRWRERAFR